MRACPWLFALALLGVGAACARDAVAGDWTVPRLKVSLGYDYSSGKYENAQNTDISYVPLTLKAEAGRWTVQGSIPYVRISGPGGLINGPGGVIQSTKGVAEGLGDIPLRISYALDAPAKWVPFVDLVGFVKFPTASRGDGLGTGEFDAGPECDFFWGLGRWTPFGTVGYRYLGSPPDQTLRNVALASAGATYRVLAPLSAGLLLDYRQAASSSSGTRLDLVPFGTWKVDRHWSVDLYTSAGLATGSPAVGVGLQLGYAFGALSPVPVESW